LRICNTVTVVERGEMKDDVGAGSYLAERLRIKEVTLDNP
jgi:hypothetical protein